MLVDWNNIYINVWGGILACVLQLIHDTEQIMMNNYQVHDAGIWILNSSAFFTLGVVFTMGIIFLQFIPKNKFLKVIYIIGFAFGFLSFEFITVSNGMLKHIHHSYLLSLADNLMVMATLAWSKNFIISVYSFAERKS